MTTIAASASTPLTFAAGGIESLSDLDSQMEQRKQERMLRRQERERKRQEDMKRSGDETNQTSYRSPSASQVSKPQPTNTKSSDNLQRLDKELEEMRRVRQSRRTSMVQMGSDAAIASQPSIKKENPGRHDHPNTKLLGKDRDQPGTMLILEESVPLKPSSKLSEASLKTATKTQDNNMLEENKISTDRYLAEKESPKVVTSTDAKLNTTSKAQAKKSVLSRYSIAIENSESKQTHQSKSILPSRTTSSLAERAAIFSTVQQAETTPVVNKRKSTSVLKFPSLPEKSDSDGNTSSISPSVCVSHRFGQSPQITKRRSTMLEDQAAAIGVKKSIIGAVNSRSSLEVKPYKDAVCAQKQSLPKEQELCLSSSPTEIKFTPVMQQQNLMERDMPPLKHAKKPMSPRVQKKRQSPKVQASVRPATNTLPNVAETKPYHDEEAQKVVASNYKISNKGKQMTEKKSFSETKSAGPEDITADLNRVTLRSRVQSPPKEMKIAEENEAKAIRERILAKRKSTSTLNIQSSKSHNDIPKAEEPAEHQFMKIRAKLGRQGTESFRNATEKKIQELASGRRLKDTVHRWSTTDIPTADPKQETQSQEAMQRKQHTADEVRRPALSVLPNTTVSTSAIIKKSQTESLPAEPLLSTQTSKQTRKVDKPLPCEKVSLKRSNEQQCTDAKSVKSQTSYSEARAATKSVNYLKETIVTAKLNDRVKKPEPSGRASLKKRAYSSSDLKAIRKAFEQVNNTEQPIASKRSSSQDIHKKVTMEVAAPVKKVHEIHQTSISNLQIVSPMPRKLTPEPIELANKADFISKAEPQTARPPLENKSWSTRKVLPTKLDMMQLNIAKPNEQFSITNEKHDQIQSSHAVEKREPMYYNNASIPQADHHNQDLACNAGQSRSMNRSPTGSDDSSLLDTPKEGKKVSFSPTITTFRLDPEDEYDESNQDYFKTKGSAAKEGAYHDIEAISELPPPMQPLHQYSHQQTSMPSGDYSFADEKRDTSAFWKAFSSEMTNVSHMYSDRDSRGSMLPPPDHPDNYYTHDQMQKSQPSWVKKSMEGGRPEPAPAAPSMWRNSGIWDNLFGRKSNGDS